MNLIKTELKDALARLSQYIKKQKTELKIGGWKVFLRKIYTVLLTFPALLSVCIFRLLRPVTLIRITPLNSDRLGSFGGYIDTYLCERKTGMHTHKILDFFYCTFPICNKQLLKMFLPFIRILKYHRLANRIYKINEFFPGSRNYTLQTYFIDAYGRRGFPPPNIYFTAEEEQRRLKEIQKLGMPIDAKFVCFHARDSVFLNSIHPESDFSYHNHRDANIYNCIPAAEELILRGYYMVRMGAKVKEVLNTANPMIIDYATKYRSDFLDLFLGSRCSFFISSTCGITELASLFRRPLLSTNWIFPYESVGIWSPYDIVIPRKFWLIREKRLLTYREVLHYGIKSWNTLGFFKMAGVEPIENTADEIRDAAIEMDERLRGIWKSTDEDEELQQRFLYFLKEDACPWHGKIKGRIGAGFLRKNKELLE